MTDLNVKTVSTLDNKELDHLIKILNQEKADRKEAKRKKLIDTFQKAWIAIEAEGYDFFYQGTPLFFEDLEIL